jgi:DNA-binding NarL/FixJ family response regulator
MKTVLIVDDHPVMRYGLTQLIESEGDLEVCGEAGTATEAFGAVGSLKPDLVLIDLTLPDKSGLELIKEIKAHHEETDVLVVSMHDETLYAERALRAGARGYIMKEAAAENLIDAIRRVIEGRIYVSEKMAAHLLELISGQAGKAATSPLERLTDREFEVFQLIGAGRGSRNIADQLHVSVRTIDAHRAHIKEKLGLADGNALMRYAVRWVETGEVDQGG